MADMLPFMAAQIAGGVAATYVFRWLYAADVES